MGGKPSKRRSIIIRWTVISTFLLSAFAVAAMLITNMPSSSYSGPLKPLSEMETVIRDHLIKHVKKLAEEIGERNMWHFARLEASADYIEEVFKAAGYEVSEQAYEVQGNSARNLEVEIPGADRPDEIIVVGAHYDSVIGSPGANDNGSGVAAVLEIARLFREKTPSRTVRFAAFVNEEPPFFQTRTMGSRVYAARSKKRAERIVAMISLETIGFYSDEQGSQQYPFPFSLFYPDTGDFLGFVGNLASRGLVRRAIASFRDHTSFPSEGAAAPGWITGIGWSDHWSFWKEGYPAIMLTDTAPFRYRFYHTAQDTPDKIDYERTARVVAGIDRMISDLADRVKEE